MLTHYVLEDLAVVTHSSPNKNHQTDTFFILFLDLYSLKVKAEVWLKSTVENFESEIFKLPLKLSYRMPWANEARREIVCKLLVHSKERLEDSRLGASYFSRLRL